MSLAKVRAGRPHFVSKDRVLVRRPAGAGVSRPYPARHAGSLVLASLFVGDTQVMFGKSPWHTLIPTRCSNDNDIDKERELKLLSWTRGLEKFAHQSKA